MVIEYAKEALRVEARSIENLIDRVGSEFERAVDLILASKGRVILTGMGKSGLIARKIVATLNSTGTPSLFLHPAEATHGDLGMVTGEDIVLAISNSGRTAELNTILPMLKSMGAKLIAFTGDLSSPMAQMCDALIDVGVEREACPMGVTPTCSTTAALAMGDALAVALIHRRQFNQHDFKRFHPGGSLGERLSIKVSQIMLTETRLPVVFLGTTIRDAVSEIDAKRVGAAVVVKENMEVSGIITDGDLRRALLRQELVHDMKVEELMTPSPKFIGEKQTAAEALGLMEINGITHLVVVDGRNRLRGLVHLHDLLGRESFRINGGLRPPAANEE